jgi:integrase
LPLVSFLVLPWCYHEKQSPGQLAKSLTLVGEVMPAITKRFVDSLKSGPKPQIFWDDTVPGFAVRIMPTGFISFLVQYRAGKGRAAPTRKVSLGQYGKITPDQARDLARKELLAAAMGGDPVGERKAKLVAAREARERAWPVVLEAFITDHVTGLRTSAVVERSLRKHTLAPWAHKRVDRIVKKDVIALLEQAKVSATPQMARLLRAYLSKLFTWCEQRDLVQINPVRGTMKPGQVIERDRVLSEAELRAMWIATFQQPYPFGTVVRMLVLTAQRRQEVSTLRWDALDFGNAIWTISRETTKADRAHEVPLSGMAMELLASLERYGDYVFTSDGRTFVQAFSDIKTRLDRDMTAMLSNGKPDFTLNEWRFHDLRRTAATYMGRNGVQRDAITLVLNHSLPGITAIYDRAARLPEKRHALDTWARVLKDIITPPSGNIVPLRERKEKQL